MDIFLNSKEGVCVFFIVPDAQDLASTQGKASFFDGLMNEVFGSESLMDTAVKVGMILMNDVEVGASID